MRSLKKSSSFLRIFLLVIIRDIKTRNSYKLVKIIATNYKKLPRYYMAKISANDFTRKIYDNLPCERVLKIFALTSSIIVHEIYTTPAANNEYTIKYGLS